jgi:ABC-type branched-subunit amino acid transport system ATPase component
VSLGVESVTAGYGDIIVLREVSFAIPQGRILGVLGRNGMGKTTLIRTLAGLIRPTSGRIVYDGEDVTNLPPHKRAERGLTTVVQGRGIFPKLTVRENLIMGRIASGKPKRDRMAEVLDYFPRLGERMGQLAGTMSGGEQQMLAIGRALMTDPKLMLLDEPSDGIMPILVDQIASTLVDINRNEGLSIIVVEQNVPMVFKMAESCIVLEKGRLVVEGTKDEVSRSEVMREYLAL